MKTAESIAASIQDFDKAVALAPLRADAYLDLALARSFAKDKNGALADLNKAIELEPQNAVALTNRAALRQERGDNEGAIADYTAAIKADPTVAQATPIAARCCSKKDAAPKPNATSSKRFNSIRTCARSSRNISKR